MEIIQLKVKKYFKKKKNKKKKIKEKKYKNAIKDENVEKKWENKWKLESHGLDWKMCL